MKKVKIFKDVLTITYNLEQYNKNNNLLLITGLSGAGKTTLTKKMSEKYNAKIIEWDYLSKLYKDTSMNETTRTIINEFIIKYPQIEKELQGEYWQYQKLNNFGIYEEWGRRFFNFVLEFCNKNKGQRYIIEGTQIFMTLNPYELFNIPIMFAGTSAIHAYIRRIKREITPENKKHFFTSGLKHFIKLTKDSKRLHYIDYKKLNEFIKIIDNNKATILK